MPDEPKVPTKVTDAISKLNADVSGLPKFEAFNQINETLLSSPMFSAMKAINAAPIMKFQSAMAEYMKPLANVSLSLSDSLKAISLTFPELKQKEDFKTPMFEVPRINPDDIPAVRTARAAVRTQELLTDQLELTERTAKAVEELCIFTQRQNEEHQKLVLEQERTASARHNEQMQINRAGVNWAKWACITSVLAILLSCFQMIFQKPQPVSVETKLDLKELAPTLNEIRSDIKALKQKGKISVKKPPN